MIRIAASVIALAMAEAALWTYAGPYVALGVLLALAVGFGDVVLAAWVNRRVPVQTGAEAMVGRGAVIVKSESMRGERWHGRIRIDAEIWNAYADSGSLRAGDPVRVESIEGLRLRVARMPRQQRSDVLYPSNQSERGDNDELEW